MSKNKQQHYISVFYLYNFTNKMQREGMYKQKKRDVNIWHFNKETKILKEKSLGNLANKPYHFSSLNEDGSYDHSVDDELKAAENNASKAIKKLIKKTSNIKNKLTQTLELENDILESILIFCLWQAKRHPDIKTEIEQKCENFSKKESLDIDIKTSSIEVLRKVSNNFFTEALTYLKNKNSQIIVTTVENVNFITTDQPFTMFNSTSPFSGIDHNETEIYFPLSSKMFLLLYGVGNKRTFKLSNNRKYVKNINVFLAENAKNYIFGNSKEHVESIVKLSGS